MLRALDAPRLGLQLPVRLLQQVPGRHLEEPLRGREAIPLVSHLKQEPLGAHHSLYQVPPVSWRRVSQHPTPNNQHHVQYQTHVRVNGGALQIAPKRPRDATPAVAAPVLQNVLYEAIPVRVPGDATRIKQQAASNMFSMMRWMSSTGNSSIALFYILYYCSLSQAPGSRTYASPGSVESTTSVIPEV